MSDLLDKLNVLLKASMNNFLSGSNSENDSARPGKIPAGRLGKDVDQEIARLRDQVNKALAQEDDMQARVEATQKHLDELDGQADDAVQRNDDANARALLQQLQRQKQLLTTQQADLEQHRQATFEVLQHLNTLEAMVSDARHQELEKQQQGGAQNEKTDQGLPPDAVPLSVESSDAPNNRTPVALLSDLLRTVRERVEEVAVTRKPNDPSANETSSAENTANLYGTVPVGTQGTPVSPVPAPQDTPASSATPKITSTVKIKIGGANAAPGNSDTPPSNLGAPDAPQLATPIKVSSQSAPTESKLPADIPPTNKAPNKTVENPQPGPAPTEKKADNSEDDDLAKRRSRLSKPE